MVRPRAASLAACITTLTLAACAPALAAVPRPDPVLEALLGELDRDRAGLQLEGYERPYYVALVVLQTEEHDLGAKLGALAVDQRKKSRQATADVRVGSYALDSSADPEQDWVEEGLIEPSSAVPLDDGPLAALRHTLWLVTDFRYKQALASYLKVKGQGVHRLDDREDGPSFSAAPPTEHLDPLTSLSWDDARWRRVARTLSARLARDPILFDSEVRIEASLQTRWLVNTEGARIRTVRPMFAIHATGWTRADDGMAIDHSFDLYAPSEAGLPSEADLTRAIDQLLETLRALRVAPILEPYTGPAIVDATATGVLFHEILGHRLEGHRQGADGDGQTFSRYLGQPILPDFLSLFDDPTLATLAGQPLNGAYRIDDEGVRAERVTLIDRGVLKSFLNPRRPGPGATRSNGHGRAAGLQRPVARQGNLLLVAHRATPEADLKGLLIQEARRQNKHFGLIIRDLAGGQTNTSSFGYQAFKGEARTVYKVDVDTGHETLVRGVDLVGTPLATLGKILAVGDRPGVFNGFCGAESGFVPVSAIAPATLFSEVELQRSARPRSRPPVLPNPLAPARPSEARP